MATFYNNLRDIFDTNLKKSDNQFFGTAITPTTDPKTYNDNFFIEFTSDSSKDIFYEEMRQLANTPISTSYNSNKIKDSTVATPFDYTGNYEYKDNMFEFTDDTFKGEALESDQTLVEYEIVKHLYDYYKDLKEKGLNNFELPDIISDYDDSYTYTNTDIIAVFTESAIKEVIKNHHLITLTINEEINENPDKYFYKNFNVYVNTMLCFYEAILFKMNAKIGLSIKKMYTNASETSTKIDNYLTEIENKIKEREEYYRFESKNENTNSTVLYKNSVEDIKNINKKIEDNQDKISNLEVSYNIFEKTEKINLYIYYLILIYIIMIIIGFILISLYKPEIRELYTYSILWISLLIYIVIELLRRYILIENFTTVSDFNTNLDNLTNEMKDYLHKVATLNTYQNTTQQIFDKEKDKYQKINMKVKNNKETQKMRNNDILHESNKYKNLSILLIHFIIILTILYLIHLNYPNESLITYGILLFIISIVIFIYQTVYRSRGSYKHFDWISK
tara:strand:+ start:8712 stop:10229 length:1518 start_codon:yes stop_codon:yes gene_type:complete